MKLKSITLSGFRSFAEGQHLDIEGMPPGLYLVSGVNEVEPALEANGSGKSSLFEAFYWAFFGKTSKGLRAAAVKHWDRRTTAATVILEGTCVSRTWSPNTLKLNGSEIDQEALEQQLRLTPEVALNTFYFAQGIPLFVDLSPTARMDLYSAALGLEFWEEKATLARSYASGAEEAARTLMVSYTRAHERALTLKEANFDADIAAWQQQHGQKVDDLNTTIRLHLEAGAALDEALTKANAATVKEKSKLEAAQRSVTAAKEAFRLAQRTQSTAQAAATTKQQKLDEAEDQLERFKKLGTGECFLCGQQITAKHRKEHLFRLEAEVEEARAVAKETRDKWGTTVAAANQAEAALDKAEAACSTDAYHTARAQAQAKARELEEAEVYYNKLIKELEELESEVNPFVQARDKNAAEVRQAEATAAKLLAELQDAQTSAAQLEFWIKGFRDVRFQILQESLIQLNTEVNECLYELGLEDWRLEFVVETETKSGTVKKGFQCLVHNPHTEQAVPWEAWSGGEAQRLRLAVQLGVSNMLGARLGHNMDFEFWDEPSNYLSTEGIKDLLAVLQERAQRYGRRIFLADHRSLDYPFDGELQVTKSESGSSFKFV